MIWTIVTAGLIGAFVLTGYSRKFGHMWSSSRFRSTAAAVLVISFVITALIRIVLWTYLVLTLAVVVVAVGIGFISLRAYTRKRPKVVVAIAVAVLLVPIGIVSTRIYHAITHPTAVIEGRVVYGESGLAANGVDVHVQSVHGSGQDSGGHAVTDANGVYRLNPLPVGTYNVFVKADGWTAEAIGSFELHSRSKVPDMTLIRGTLVRGRAVDAITGNPTASYQIGVYGPARPKSGAAVQSTQVQSDGTFELRLPPGWNFIYAMRSNDGNLWIDVPEEGPMEVELLVK